MAKGLLGHPVATRRKLLGKVAICSREPDARRPRAEVTRLALSRRNPFFELVIRVLLHKRHPLRRNRPCKTTLPTRNHRIRDGASRLRFGPTRRSALQLKRRVRAQYSSGAAAPIETLLEGRAPSRPTLPARQCGLISLMKAVLRPARIARHRGHPSMVTDASKHGIPQQPSAK